MKKIRSPEVQVKFSGSYNVFYLVFFDFIGWSSGIVSLYFSVQVKSGSMLHHDTNPLRNICYVMAVVTIKHMCALSE